MNDKQKELLRQVGLLVPRFSQAMREIEGDDFYKWGEWGKFCHHVAELERLIISTPLIHQIRRDMSKDDFFTAPS